MRISDWSSDVCSSDLSGLIDCLQSSTYPRVNPMEDNLTQPLDDLTVVKTVSLTNALEKQIERLIVEGELAPGERLNAIQLAGRFGTSRGPLREATRRLEAKGFVEVIRHRGVFVRQLSFEEALAVYDVRAALFGLP